MIRPGIKKLVSNWYKTGIKKLSIQPWELFNRCATVLHFQAFNQGLQTKFMRTNLSFQIAEFMVDAHQTDVEKVDGVIDCRLKMFTSLLCIRLLWTLTCLTLGTRVRIANCMEIAQPFILILKFQLTNHTKIISYKSPSLPKRNLWMELDNIPVRVTSYR